MLPRNFDESHPRILLAEVDALRQELRHEAHGYIENLLAVQKERINHIQEKTDETKRICIDVQERSMLTHKCSQLVSIQEMRKSIQVWSNWWRGIMVTVILAILGLGGVIAGWWMDQAELKGEVTGLHGKMVQVESAFTDFRAEYAEKEANDLAGRRQQVAEIKEAVTDAVSSALQKPRPRRK